MPFKHIKTKHRNILLPPEVQQLQGTHKAPDKRCKASKDFSNSSVGVTSKLMVPPAISEQRLLGRGSFSFKACSHAGDSDGRLLSEDAGKDKIEKFNLLLWVVHPLKIQKHTNLPTCLNQGPNLLVQFLCMPATFLLSKKHHSLFLSFSSFHYPVGNLTTHKSMAFMSCLKFKSLKRSGSLFVLRNSQGSGLVVIHSNSLVFYQIIWIKSGWMVGYVSLRCVFHYVSLKIILKGFKEI